MRLSFSQPHRATLFQCHLFGCFQKLGKHNKMDGENNGKPYYKWMIWGYHYFRKHPFDLLNFCLIWNSGSHALQNVDPVIMTLSFFLDCLMILRGKSRSIPISSSIQKPGPSKYASCETKRNHSSWCQLNIKTGQTLGMMYRTSPKPRRVQ